MNEDTAIRPAIYRELEITRLAYHKLLATLTDADWDRPTPNPHHTIGALMAHLADDVGNIRYLAAGARRGWGCNPPDWLFRRFNPWRVRWGIRQATRQTVAATYDRGHAALCRDLARVQPADWGKATTILGRHVTVADAFRLPVKHFAQHQADILHGSARSPDATPKSVSRIRGP